MNEDKSYEEKIDDLKFLIKGVIGRYHSGLIVTGRSGMGKTYNVEKTLSDNGYNRDDGKLQMFSGFVEPFGLYTLLFKHKARENVFLFDNTDSVFSKPKAAHVLKMAVKPNTLKRTVRWNEWNDKDVFDVDKFSDEEQEQRIAEGKYPNRFDFQGGIIIITNEPKEKINKHCNISDYCPLIAIN